MDQPVWFERIGPGDAQALATDVGPVPAQVGAALILAPPTGPDPSALRDLLAVRLGSVPRLRQRLRSVAPGCGRQIWVDDPHFDVHAHLAVAGCAAPGDDAAFLSAAVAAVTRPLDRTRPLWRVMVVTGLAHGQVGLVVVMHHVLADGIGGLAVLAELVDSDEVPGRTGAGAGPPPPRSAPTSGALFRDATRSRLRALRRTPRAGAAVGSALTELGRARPRRAPQCSLNAPTGPHRRLAVVSADLNVLRRTAHERGATVNDLLLVSVGHALAEVLADRGEHVSELVISVPVSARPTATAERLGNQVGVMPVRVPVRSRRTSLAEVARATAERRSTQRGSSQALIIPAFRALAALGLLRPMIERQRLVNTFLTNLRGPDRPLAVAGAQIRRIIPVTLTPGNVGVAFAAISYAGTLTVSVIVDPELVPELDVVAAALDQELRGIVGQGDPGASPR